MRKQYICITMIMLACFSVMYSCAQMVQVGTGAGQHMGIISAQNKALIDETATKTFKALRPMTEKEEYILGRAVAATILNQYTLDQDQGLTEYVNQVGQALALSSDVPITYGGYHFAVLATEEVNALSCPGGIIFISRGMLNRASNEEELASILAHEIAHVNHRDGVKAIKSSRWAEVVAALGTNIAGRYGPQNLTNLTQLFEGSVDDIVKTMVVNGYSRQQEKDADRSALILLQRVGYDPNSFADYLEKLAREQEAGSRKGFFSTHPAMTDRLAIVNDIIAQNNWQRAAHTIRDQRYASLR
ncbi:MAG: M48 family metalloprotease [Deltaproteobacteria bacterium]|nr:M48 family metalloprotease [Deltaproteobacteria bacterium]